jgi:hypothetical protein
MGDPCKEPAAQLAGKLLRGIVDNLRRPIRQKTRLSPAHLIAGEPAD